MTTLNVRNINKLIRHWRKVRDASLGKQRMIASCYVDAFQTVRKNHGLQLLRKDKKD